MTADDLLAEARAVLPHRPGPAEALAAQAKGALLIDILGDDQRRAGGLIPGALVLPRNSLEWRCDPADRGREVIGEHSRPGQPRSRLRRWTNRMTRSAAITGHHRRMRPPL